MSCLLGIDVGTTGTKSALFNTSGDLIDLSYSHYGLNYPREGWAEQSAEDWWKAVKETVGEIVSRNKVSEDITGMSISANGGATVLLDETTSIVQCVVPAAAPEEGEGEAATAEPEVIGQKPSDEGEEDA